MQKVIPASTGDTLETQAPAVTSLSRCLHLDRETFAEINFHQSPFKSLIGAQLNGGLKIVMSHHRRGRWR